MAINKYKTYKYKVNGLNLAATSQKSNFNVEKLQSVIKQSLSLWTAFAPINFKEITTSDYDFDISFKKEAKKGYIGRLEIGGKNIVIDVDYRFFIDKYNEPEYPPYQDTWDLISVLTHEIGHFLKLEHVPRDPKSGADLYPNSIMSLGLNIGEPRRVPTQFDIDNLIIKHKALLLTKTLPTNLQENSTSNENFEGFHFIKDSWGVQVDGPVGHKLSLSVFMPETKLKKIISVSVNFKTFTKNTIVHSIEMFDGINPIQTYFISAASSYKQWEFILGILDKKSINTGISLKFNLEFRDVIKTHDVGVFQLISAKAKYIQEVMKDDFPKGINVVKRDHRG